MDSEKIEVSLGKREGKKVFNSLDEIQEWVAKEAQFWIWIQNPPWTNVKQQIYPQYQNFFNRISELVRQGMSLRSGANEAQVKNCLATIQQTFSHHYEAQYGISSGTPLAAFIAKLYKDEGDTIACSTMAFAMRRPYNLNEIDGFRGAQLAFAFESGLLERAPHEVTALEKVRSEWGQTFQRLKETLQNEAGNYNRLNADAKKWLNDERERFKNVADQQSAANVQSVADTKRQWLELRKTYDESLALRSPVTYWTKKAQSHLWLSWVFGVVSIGVSGAALYFLVPTVKDIIAVPKGIQDPEKWHPEYWRLAILVACALFGVWVIRIFVRLFLSHVHLLTDANERVVMTKTYLALLRRGKLKDDQALYILQCLFRPSQTGIVKDDAVPLTIVEGITKLKG